MLTEFLVRPFPNGTDKPRRRFLVYISYVLDSHTVFLATDREGYIRQSSQI